jgi:arginase family enzyme
MDFAEFLSPTEWHFADLTEVHSSSLIHDIRFYNSDEEWDWTGCKIAIIGVEEDRHSQSNTGASQGPDSVRRKLYHLTKWDENPGIVDLGNVKAGSESQDTFYAVRSICEFLIKKEIIPLIIGGTQDITYANYLAYENLEQTVNLVTVDSKLDFATTHDDSSSDGYLNKIVLHKPNYLFNYSNMGHQRYLTDPDLVVLMEKMYFEATRLGEIQFDTRVVEPVVRNADIVSIDMSAVRQSEMPGFCDPSANGLYGNELAQICRYAGMSDKLTSIGFYEFNPIYDIRDQSAGLLAQCIWCFVEGFLYRRGDFPKGDYMDYTRYSVLMDDSGDELVFYKSPLTDRWWMDVPYPAGSKEKYERHHLVPCSYEDYETALRQEMPDRWWKTFQKLV